MNYILARGWMTPPKVWPKYSPPEGGVLILKQGSQGATIYYAEQVSPQAVPGFRVTPRFTVGAGDSFNAGFLFALNQGQDIAEAVRFANAVAALVVSGTDGVLSCPDLGHIQTWMAQQ